MKLTLRKFIFIPHYCFYRHVFIGISTIFAGSQTNSVNLADFNNDGILDVVSGNTSADRVYIQLGNGDGSFSAAKSFLGSVTSFIPALAVGDFDGDGRVDVAVVDGSKQDFGVFLANGGKASTESYLDLTSIASALQSQNLVNGNLDRIEAQLGTLGATGSRFQIAMNNLQVQSQNFSAAASRIQNANVAEQSALLLRTQILQQAATSILAKRINNRRSRWSF